MSERNQTRTTSDTKGWVSYVYVFGKKSRKEAVDEAKARRMDTGKTRRSHL